MKQKITKLSKTTITSIVLFILLVGVIAGLYQVFYKKNLAQENLSDTKLPIKSMVSKNANIPVWYIEDKNNPIVAITLNFSAGSAHDPKNKEGLSELLMASLFEGGTPAQNLALKQKIAELYINLDTNVDVDSTTISIYLLKSDLEAAYPILNKILTSPNLDAKGVSGLKDRFKTELAIKKTDTRSRGLETLLSNMFNNYSVWHNSIGNEQSINSITINDIKNYLKSAYALDNLYVGVVGDVDSDYINNILDNLLKDLPKTNSLKPIESTPIVERTEPKVIEVNVGNASQATVLIGFKAPDINSPLFLASQVLNSALGGPEQSLSSILTKEIRINKGLTYTIYSDIENTKFGNYWYIVTNTAIANVEDIKKYTLEILSNLNNYLTDDILDEKRSGLANGWLLNFRSSYIISSNLAHWQRLGYSIDKVNTKSKRLNAISKDDINKVLSTYFNPKDITIVIAK